MTVLPLGFTVIRYHERQGSTPMFAVDGKICIQREDAVPVRQFRHPYYTGIGERHRDIPILLHKHPHRREMFGQATKSPIGPDGEHPSGPAMRRETTDQASGT